MDDKIVGRWQEFLTLLTFGINDLQTLNANHFPVTGCRINT